MKTNNIHFIEIDFLKQKRFIQKKALPKIVVKLLTNSILNLFLLSAYVASALLFFGSKKLEQRSNSKLLLKFALFNSTTHSTKYFK
jgi:hypothetical protein